MLEFLRNGATDDAVGSLWLRQVSALAIIGGLILLAQIALQWSLAGQQHDARVIAVAARQVALGEKIIKASTRSWATMKGQTPTMISSMVILVMSFQCEQQLQLYIMWQLHMSMFHQDC